MGKNISAKVIALHDYEDEGGGYLEMKTMAWVETRLISRRVEWIEQGVSVRLCNQPVRPVTRNRDQAVGRGKSIHMPLWVTLGDVR